MPANVPWRSLQRASHRDPPFQIDPSSEGAHEPQLRSVIEHDNLILCLGAGVSIPRGLPDWFGLLDRLASLVLSPKEHPYFVELVRSHGHLIPPLILGRFLKSSLFLTDHIYEALRDALYQGYKPHNAAPLVTAIVGLCEQLVCQGRKPTILTYNYDSVIEDEFNSRCPSMDVASVYDLDSYRNARAEVRIFHLHGYVPANLEIPEARRWVVFSEDDYHALYAKPNHWSNQVQMEMFRTKTCLFLGFSMGDPSVRRIMDAAEIQRGQHFCVLKKTTEGSSIRRDAAEYLDFVTAQALNNLGVQIIHSDDYLASVRLIRSLTP